MGRKKNIIKIDNSGLKKLRICMSIGFILLTLLVIRIGYLQFIQGAELKEGEGFLLLGFFWNCLNFCSEYYFYNSKHYDIYI